MIRGGQHCRYKVVARCVDEDTPFIHIYDDKTLLFTLTDMDAEFLANDIKAALHILPSSK